MGGTLGGQDDEDDEDGVRYNGVYMRFFHLDKTNSFNNLFTKMSNPE